MINTFVRQLNSLTTLLLVIMKTPAIDCWLSCTNNGISRRIDKGQSMSLKREEKEWEMTAPPPQPVFQVPNDGERQNSSAVKDMPQCTQQPRCMAN